MKLKRTATQVMVDTDRFFRKLLDDAYAQARAGVDEAGELIWHSIHKYDGDPTQDSWHPIRCGCIYCN